MNKQKLNGLLEKARDGYDDDYHKLYEYAYKPVFGYLLSLSKNYYVAEDLTQETFAALYTAIKNYQNRNSAITYVFQIAKNQFSLYLRKNSREDYYSLNDNVNIFGQTNSVSEDELFIERTLNLLDDVEREVVYLHTIKQLRHKDIARITNKPLGTVLWTYNKAIKKLRKILEAENEK